VPKVLDHHMQWNPPKENRDSSMNQVRDDRNKSGHLDSTHLPESPERIDEPECKSLLSGPHPTPRKRVHLKGRPFSEWERL
jgi:hypothetical protein